MPRRKVTQAPSDAYVQLPGQRRVHFEPGVILPVLRLFAWVRGVLVFFFGTLLDMILQRNTVGRRAVRLRRVFESAGGSFAKIGQQLSLRADLLPHAYCVELSQMLDRVPAFPVAQAIPIIERSLGRRLEDVFGTFDPDPIGAASLACVWQAKLKTGERVAVKVRRPRIGQIIAADLRALGWLLSVAETLTLVRPGRMQHFTRDLRTILFDELNFRSEARYTDLFRERSEGGDLTAPRVYFEFCTEELMVSELVSGIWMGELMAAVESKDEEFLAKARAIGIEPKSLARKIVQVMQAEALQEAFHHADPHPANLVVLPDNKICFIDFGAIGRFSNETRKVWAECQFHLITGNLSRLAHASLHFLGELPPIDVERLSDMVKQVFADFLYAMFSEDAEWWERSSSQVWFGFVEVANRFGLGLNREALQLFRATLLYESIITRLDNNFNYVREYETYGRRSMMGARKRAEKHVGQQLQRGRIDYLALEDIGDSFHQVFYKIQRGVDYPLVRFKNTVGKISYALTVCMRMAYVLLAAAGAVVAAEMIAKAWYGRPIDWFAIIERVKLFNPWLEIIAVIAAILLIRRIMSRLSVPDQRTQQ